MGGRMACSIWQVISGCRLSSSRTVGVVRTCRTSKKTQLFGVRNRSVSTHWLRTVKNRLDLKLVPTPFPRNVSRNFGGQVWDQWISKGASRTFVTVWYPLSSFFSSLLSSRRLIFYSYANLENYHIACKDLIAFLKAFLRKYPLFSSF